MEKVLFAVNGTLMRGLELHQHLLDVGAKYIETTKTIQAYRLFSIDDKYPGMIYEESGQTAPIQVEVYEIDKDKGFLTNIHKDIVMDKPVCVKFLY